MGSHKERSVYKGLILYSEDSTHLNAMSIIEQQYEYKAILHDKDIDENGELKKPHFHYIVKMPSSSPNSTLANNLGISENYVQCIHTLKGAYNYLTHKFNPEKFQYDNTDLFGSLVLDCEENQEGDFECLLKAIKTEKISSMYQLTLWSLENHCLSTLRRNAFLFSQILKINS